MYYTYMLRCDDGSLYTGYCTDYKRRYKEHSSKGAKAAKYTRSHTAVALAAVWESNTKTQATRLEYYIKTLSRDKKELLISSDEMSVLEDKINILDYKRISTDGDEL